MWLKLRRKEREAHKTNNKIDRDDLVDERIELIETRITVAEQRLRAIEAREVEERRNVSNG